MAKTYVTFGQEHVHRVNGKTLDKDTVAVFTATTREEGRAKAFEFFGPKFCFEYYDKEWNEKNLSYFPKGYVDLDKYQITRVQLYDTTKEGFRLFMEKNNLKKYDGASLAMSHTDFYVDENNVVHASRSTSSWNSNTDYRISESDNFQILSFVTALLNSKPH